MSATESGLTVDLLADELPVLRAEMLDHFSATSCVAGARIVTDVLAYFGEPTVPVSVVLRVANELWLAAAEQGEEVLAAANRAAMTAGVTRHTTGGPWIVDLGSPDVVPRQAGHVVVYVPRLGVLVDISIDQAERKHKAISGLPMLTAGDPRAGVEIRTSSGVGMYYCEADSERYKDSPNWRGRGLDAPPTVFKNLTGRSIRRLKEAVAAAGGSP